MPTQPRRPGVLITLLPPPRAPASRSCSPGSRSGGESFRAAITHDLLDIPFRIAHVFQGVDADPDADRQSGMVASAPGEEVPY